MTVPSLESSLFKVRWLGWVVSIVLFLGLWSRLHSGITKFLHDDGDAPVILPHIALIRVAIAHCCRIVIGLDLSDWLDIGGPVFGYQVGTVRDVSFMLAGIVIEEPELPGLTELNTMMQVAIPISGCSSNSSCRSGFFC